MARTSRESDAWRLIVRIAGLVIGIACSAPALAQGSDQCSAATPVTDGQVFGTTVGATNDGSALCGSSGSSPDVWYRYTPAVDCSLQVTTCGAGTTYDSVLSLHTGCPGTASNQVACNDDSCGLSSSVRFDAVAGGTVYVRVAGFGGATGPFVLNVTCAETTMTDRCDQALDIVEGTYAGTTVGAFNDGASGCGASDTSADVWYRYTTPAAPSPPCTLSVDTCGAGTSFDTVLSIHTGCPGTAGNALVCNDDSCGFSSRVEIPTAASTTYLIRVAGFGGATGTFDLHVVCTPSVQADACAGAQVIQAGGYNGDTSVATADGASMCDANTTPDVWFKYTAADNCVLRLDTCSGTTFDTVLSVHSGCPGTTANEIACNDDGCGLGSSVAVSAGAGMTYYVRLAPFAGAGGPFHLNVACNNPTSDGPDGYVGNIGAMQQFGREGGIVGCVTDTPLCNAGSAPIPTMGNPNSAHPFFVWNMYRMQSGGSRFEQIGWSWAKHMCCSAQGDACGFGCTPFPNSSHLGAGCSDTYSAGYNATQSNMGPRSEINPWTGEYSYVGSWIQRTGGAFTNSIDHRLQIRDADLNPSQNPGSQYIVEQYTVSLMDANHLNSVAREPVTVSGAPGGTWTFGTSAASENGPAIFSWTGAEFSVIPSSDSLTDDGRCIVGYRATPNQDGTWHYEYAVYNHDMNRGVQAFSVPVGGAAITNAGFHAPFIHGEDAHDNDPWTVTIAGGRIEFATDPADAAVPSNPILWGTLYNFRFDADRSPVSSAATIRPYRSGPVAAFSGPVTAPAGACIADWDHSGTVTSADFFAFLADFFNGIADVNNDGVVNTQDFFDFLGAFFSGCV
ncbi:MAG: GC-type dockerin domain-anchored protein [Phycisphaerales bacterium]